jgi:hypothetical protein
MPDHDLAALDEANQGASGHRSREDVHILNGCGDIALVIRQPFEVAVNLGWAGVRAGNHGTGFLTEASSQRTGKPGGFLHGQRWTHERVKDGRRDYRTRPAKGPGRSGGQLQISPNKKLRFNHVESPS